MAKELPGPLVLKKGYIRTKQLMSKEEMTAKSLKFDGWGQQVKHIQNKTYYEPKEFYYIKKVKAAPSMHRRHKAKPKPKPKRHVQHKKQSSWW